MKNNTCWRTIVFSLCMIFLILALSDARFSYSTWGKSNGMLTMQINDRVRECAYHWIFNSETSSYVWVLQDEPYKGELEYYYLFGWVDGKFVLFKKK